jgi:hypothetical protein
MGVVDGDCQLCASGNLTLRLPATRVEPSRKERSGVPRHHVGADNWPEKWLFRVPDTPD